MSVHRLYILSPLNDQSSMKNSLLKFLYFNRPERMGAASLLLIGAIALLMPILYRWCSPKQTTDFSAFKADIEKLRNALPPDVKKPYDDGSVSIASEAFFFNPNTAELKDFIRLGLSEKTAQSICNYRNKGGQFRKPEDFKKIYTLSAADYDRLLPYIRLGASEQKGGKEYPESTEKSSSAQPFNFDPNTATEAQFIQLGLSRWIAERVLNYRSKGGKFRNKEDLEKIYGFPQADYDRLEPYITIASVEQAPRPQAYTTGNNNVGSHPVSRPSVAPGSLDINRAAIEHWQMLPGIGEKRAQMIVNYREKLGGFISVEQVAETRGLPDSIYQRIHSMLALQTGALHTVNINTSTTEQLNAHPYISFKQASLIIAHRSQNGNYQKVEDLLKIPAFIDKAWLERIRPYLAVQ